MPKLESYFACLPAPADAVAVADAQRITSFGYDKDRNVFVVAIPNCRHKGGLAEAADAVAAASRVITEVKRNLDAPESNFR